MMRARVNLITADPDRMADTIGYIKTSVRPAIDSMDGSLGLSLYANADIGVAVLESFWASRHSRRGANGPPAALAVDPAGQARIDQAKGRPAGGRDRGLRSG